LNAFGSLVAAESVSLFRSTELARLAIKVDLSASDSRRSNAVAHLSLRNGAFPFVKRVSLARADVKRTYGYRQHDGGESRTIQYLRQQAFIHDCGVSWFDHATARPFGIGLILPSCNELPELGA